MILGSTEFTTTRWSLILRAGKWDRTDAPAAMDEFCRLYWFPLYAYVRRKGYSAEDCSRPDAGLLAFLTSGGDPPRRKAAADALRLSIPAFKSLLHRFRQRYRELLFAEVAETVSNPAEIEEEIRGLIVSLRKR